MAPFAYRKNKACQKLPVILDIEPKPMCHFLSTARAQSLIMCSFYSLIGMINSLYSPVLNK